MIKVRIGDIQLGDEEKRLVTQVLDTAIFSENRMTRDFEKAWSEYIGTKYCVAVNSGTSALLAGLFALLYDDRFPKITKGCKVITSPVTYIATSNAIILAGMEPVYVDIDPVTFTLNTDQIAELLAKGNPDEYGLILPVHLMGYPNDMDTLNELATRYNLVIFEDAAQAHGSLYKGKKVGSLSLLADYSFYIAHNIQVGEMGAVVTSDNKIRGLIKQIKANGRVCACPICTRREGTCPHKGKGIDPRFTHDFVGFNFKTTEFHTAIAIPQIKKAKDIILARQRNVLYLNEQLSQYSDRLQLPLYSDSVSYLAYPIIIKDLAIDRSQMLDCLEDTGVECRPLFGCIPNQQPSFASYKNKYLDILPVANHIGNRGFYVGCHQYLTNTDLDLICTGISAILKPCN